LDSLGDLSATSRRLGRLLNIAKALSARIIVEGIKDQAEAAFLKDIGVHYAQGPCFGGLGGLFAEEATDGRTQR